MNANNLIMGDSGKLSASDILAMSTENEKRKQARTEKESVDQKTWTLRPGGEANEEAQRIRKHLATLMRVTGLKRQPAIFKVLLDYLPIVVEREKEARRRELDQVGEG